MRPLVLLAFLVAAAPAAADAPEGLGYSLDDQWNEIWRRIFDREGRPDPDGPIQQRNAVMLYPEYELNLAVPQFPMRLERDWTERAAGR